ncbi:hypothetical protein GCM10028811_07340 [Uliginosibacterium sediminicola]
MRAEAGADYRPGLIGVADEGVVERGERDHGAAAQARGSVRCLPVRQVARQAVKAFELQKSLPAGFDKLAVAGG